MKYFLMALLLSSCVDKAVHLSSEKEGWFWGEGTGLLYCKSNNENSRIADPTCVMPNYFDPERKWNGTPPRIPKPNTPTNPKP